jgi:hypothetical protein
MCKKFKVIGIVVVIFLLVLSPILVLSESWTQSIEVIFNKVNLSVNGNKIDLPNILFEEVTYVPLRSVADALGKDVGWDGETNTVSINDKVVATPTPTPTIKPTPTPTPIPSFDTNKNIIATTVKFFEGGNNAPIKTNRVYSSQFNKSTSRFIYWELSVKSQLLKQDQILNLKFEYYDSSGKYYGGGSNDKGMFIIKANTDTSEFFWSSGWDTQGNWAPGKYNAYIYINDVKVSSSQFEIIDDTEQSFKNSCEIISFTDLARYPDKYTSKPVVFIGEIIQVIQDGNFYTFRINVTNKGSYYTDTVLVYYTKNENEGNFLDDDIVQLWGTFGGQTSYSSILGQKITIPFVYANYMSLIK